MSFPAHWPVHTENSRTRFEEGEAELPSSMAYRVGLVGGIGDRMGDEGWSFIRSKHPPTSHMGVDNNADNDGGG